MRVILVSEMLSPNFYQLARGLSSLGHQVVCYYVNLSTPSISLVHEANPEFDMNQIPAKTFRVKRTPFSISTKLFSLLLESEFDIVHTSEFCRPTSSICLFVSLFRKKKCVITSLLYLPLPTFWSHPLAMLTRAFVPFMSKALKIICVSRAAYNTATLLGFNRSKLCIIPPCVDTDRFKPSKKDDYLREQLGIKRDKVVLTVARLCEVKGISYLLRSWKQIMRSDRNLDAELVIIGRDDKNRYQKLAKELHLNNILFIEEYPDLSLVYPLADLFVLPSRYEQFSNALLEATASGLPTIGTKVGGIVDIIKNGETGLLVDFGSITQLSQAIISLLKDESKLCKMASNARKLALKEFNYIKVAKRTELIYGSSLHRNTDMR